MIPKVRILGLDLSLTATGIYCDTCGGSVFKPKVKGAERLSLIETEVAGHYNHIDIAIIEGYSFGSKGRATFNIGELGGVIRLSLFDDGLSFVEVPPASLKKFATGKGNVGKDEVIASAIRKLSFKGSDNNECDAFVLNRMGNYFYNKTSIALSYQQEVLDKVEWPEV
jgi:crossover junction endodeoxyribonuclease RuvC